MTCREMDSAIGSPSEDLTLHREAAQHVDECEVCRLLVEALDKGHGGLEPSGDQLKEIHATIKKDLKPIRPLASARVFFLAFLLISLAFVAAGSLRLGMNGWAACSRIQATTVIAALTASTILLAVSVARQMAPGDKQPISPRLLPIGILALLIFVTAAIFQVQRESTFIRDGLTCLRNGLTYSIPAALVFWGVLSRGAILYPTLTGAVGGAFAGLIGYNVLEVACSNLDVYHILVWHLGVILLSSIGGLSLGAAVEVIRGRGIRRSSRL